MKRYITSIIIITAVTVGFAWAADAAVSTHSFTNIAPDPETGFPGRGSHPGTLTYSGGQITVDLSGLPEDTQVYRAVFVPNRKGHYGRWSSPNIPIEVKVPGLPGEYEDILLEIMGPRYLTLEIPKDENGRVPVVEDAINSPDKELVLNVVNFHGLGNTHSSYCQYTDDETGKVVLRLDITCDQPLAGTATPLPMKQPSGIAARHQDGDTMITWIDPEPLHDLDILPDTDLQTLLKSDENPNEIRYRIYRYTTQITPDNITHAELVDEVDAATVWDWRYLGHGYHVEYGDYPDLCIPRYPIDNGVPADCDMGIYVYKARESQRVWYAVTRVIDGAEDLTDLVAGENAASEYVEETPGSGMVLLRERQESVTFRYVDDATLNYYVKWEAPPNFNLPNEPFDYLVAEPPNVAEKRPVSIALHHYGGWLNGGYIWWYKDIRGGLLVATNMHPTDSWTGFHENCGTLKPLNNNSGSVQPFAQRRVMAFVDDFVANNWSIDTERILLYGANHGASGSSLWGIKTEDYFSHIVSHCGVHIPADCKGYYMVNWFEDCYGQIEWGLDYNDTGFPVWDYEDNARWLHENQKTETPHITFSNRKEPSLWPQAWRFAKALIETRRPFCFKWGMEGNEHRGVHAYLPGGGSRQLNPDMIFRLHQSLPAFTNGSLDNCLGNIPFQAEDSGLINYYYLWDTETDPQSENAVVDTETEWQMTIYLYEEAPEDTATVDITPRRLQAFNITSGEAYEWENENLADGSTQSGVMIADENNLITLPGVIITKRGDPTEGNRISVKLADAGTPVDRTSPSPIGDLRASDITRETATLTWSAPTDTGEGSSGLAERYDIRYLTNPLEPMTEADWNEATQLHYEPEPEASGTPQSFELDFLSIETTYYFAVKSIDRAGNVSELSNVATVITTAQHQTLDVALFANPHSGRTPLNNVSLTASVTGEAQGNINYYFYSHRPDETVDITYPTDAEFINTPETTVTALDAASYTSPGTYTAKVIVERGDYIAERRVNILVTEGAPPSIAATHSFTNTPFRGSSPGTLTYEYNSTLRFYQITVDLSGLPQDTTVYRAVFVPHRKRHTGGYPWMDDGYPIKQVEVEAPILGGEYGDRLLKIIGPRYLTLDVAEAVRGALEAPDRRLILNIVKFLGLGTWRSTYSDDKTGQVVFRLDVTCDQPLPYSIEEQPTNIDVRHQNGDTLITWIDPAPLAGSDTIRGSELEELQRQTNNPNEIRYRIYRHTSQITPDTIGQAELVDEVDPLTVWDWKYYGHLDYGGRVIPLYPIDNEEPASYDMGMYVHSRRDRAPEDAHYAVTRVIDGVEDFTNITSSGRVPESQGTGMVLLRERQEGVRFQSIDNTTLNYYVRWEAPPNFNIPAEPFDYLVAEPEVSTQNRAINVALHDESGKCLNSGHLGWYGHEDGSLFVSTNQRPYDRCTAFSEYHGTIEVFTKGTMQPFTQRRIKSFVDDFVAKEPQWSVDTKRIILSGQKMGGTGASLWGIKNGDYFANIVSMSGKHIPYETPRGYGGSFEPAFGKRDWQLPYCDTGLSVWDYEDSVRWLNDNLRLETSHISFSNGKDDNQWADVWSFTQTLIRTKRPFTFKWGLEGNTIRPLLPGEDEQGNSPIGFSLNQSLPAFANGSLDDPLGDTPETSTEEGMINYWYLWETDKDPQSPDVVVDTPDQWEITIYLPDTAPDPEPEVTVDLTPRRLQNFNIMPRALYNWENIQEGAPIQTGTVIADENGLITLPSVIITKQKNRIVVTPCELEPGDVDGDTRITLADAVLCARYAVGLDDGLSQNQIAAADVDLDENVTLKDALLIGRRARGIEGEFGE